MYEIAKFSAVS